ncbi:peptidylprolyl isomerase [Candidatus Woesearchaeota archaeon]|nr:peptidylprolyl isomerase [Candidatus Woesearchaeota archaeon]
MALNKNDFIEVEYTGKTKEEGFIFDTTDEKTAKSEGLGNENIKYGPVKICIGQGQIIKGIDKQLEGKEVGKEYTFEVEPEDAFGKKNAQLVQLISTAKFKKANIQPQPGLQVNIDDQIGIIKTVSGGRTLVDFNHPLSGKTVVYQLKILSKIDDKIKHVEILLDAMLQMEETKASIADDVATVELPVEIPKEVQDVLKKKVIEITKLKDVIFKKSEAKK